MVDLVTSCIDGDDRDAVDAALDRSHEALWEKLCAAYEELRPRRYTPKEIGEFVPGWRMNIIGGGGGWYGLDIPFVIRAILYSHRVALADPLRAYAENPSEWCLPPATLKEDLHKILFYGPFEKAGLLFYVDTIVADNRDTSEEMQLSENEALAYHDEYMSRRRYFSDKDWEPSPRTAFSARVAAEIELQMAVPMVRTLLDWQRRNAEYFDLYFPQVPMYRDAREWLMRRDGSSVLGTKSDDPETAALDALWSLPTPSPESYSKLTVKDLLDIRMGNAFERWRASLRRAIEAAEVEMKTSRDTDRTFGEFLRAIDAERRQVEKGVRRVRPFRPTFGEWGKFGLSIAIPYAATVGASGLFHDTNLAASAAKDAAGPIASVALEAGQSVRLAFQRRRESQALRNHFALFASD
jgi:hypothetical protein